MYKSLFVAIEGIDRSGKSSLSKALKESLAEKNISATIISYPNRKNHTGSLINELLQGKLELSKEAVHLLFSANRWEDRERISNLLAPTDNRDRVLICDRYTLSGISYSLANGLSEEFSLSSEKNILLPDITLFLDVTPDVTSQRNGFGEEIYENTEFQSKVYKEMKKNLSLYPHTIIPNSTLETMHSRILSEVLSLLNPTKENGISEH